MKKFERDVKAVKKALRPKWELLGEIATRAGLPKDDVSYILKCMIEEGEVSLFRLSSTLPIPLYAIFNDPIKKENDNVETK